MDWAIAQHCAEDFLAKTGKVSVRKSIGGSFLIRSPRPRFFFKIFIEISERQESQRQPVGCLMDGYLRALRKF